MKTRESTQSRNQIASAKNGIKNSLVAFGGLLSMIAFLATAPATAEAQLSQFQIAPATTRMIPGTRVVPIVAGTAENNSKFTWVMQLLGVGGGETCRGVLIAPTWVLTAAHCIGPNHNGGRVAYSRKDAVTGATTGSFQDTGLNSTFIHPEYRPGFPDSDLALVRLPAPFPADPLLQTAELPRVPPVIGQQGTVANFSHTTMLPDGQLAALRAPVLLVGGKSFTARSATASLCSGDSGSGFMTSKAGLNVVTGIVSQAVLGDCKTPDHEFTAVAVYQHLGWITSVAGILPRNSSLAERANADYDGDGMIDPGLRTALGDWKIDYSGNGYGFWDASFPGYGGSGSWAVPRDYDGDGKADLSVKSDAGKWYIDYASDGFGAWDVSYSGYGASEALPVPADYDGDGKVDLSVKTNTGMWFIDYAANGFGSWNGTYSGFLGVEAHPVPADYDGDRKADLSVKTDGGVWFIDYAADGFGVWNASYSGYGALDSHPIPADYDGDKKADLSFKSDMTGIWGIDFASNTFGSVNVSYRGWSGSTFMAAPGDYDGDLRVDLAIYDRTTDTWHIDYAADGFGTVNALVQVAP